MSLFKNWPTYSKTMVVSMSLLMHNAVKLENDLAANQALYSADKIDQRIFLIKQLADYSVIQNMGGHFMDTAYLNHYFDDLDVIHSQNRAEKNSTKIRPQGKMALDVFSFRPVVSSILDTAEYTHRNMAAMDADLPLFPERLLSELKVTPYVMDVIYQNSKPDVTTVLENWAAFKVAHDIRNRLGQPLSQPPKTLVGQCAIDIMTAFFRNNNFGPYQKNADAFGQPLMSEVALWAAQTYNPDPTRLYPMINN